MANVARLYTRMWVRRIDLGIVEPMANTRTVKVGVVRRAPRFLTGEDLVRLRVWRGVGDTLSAERRHLLFVEIAARPTAKTVKADELLIVDIGEARKQVDRGLRDLEAAEAIVTKDKTTLGGEPVVKGTRIPVDGIAAMLDAYATMPGVRGVMLEFDDFVEGMEQFGQYIQPLMQTRRHIAAV